MFCLYIDPSVVVGSGVVVEQFDFGFDEFCCCCSCTFNLKLVSHNFCLLQYLCTGQSYKYISLHRDTYEKYKKVKPRVIFIEFLRCTVLYALADDFPQYHLSSNVTLELLL